MTPPVSRDVIRFSMSYSDKRSHFLSFSFHDNHFTSYTYSWALLTRPLLLPQYPLYETALLYVHSALGDNAQGNPISAVLSGRMFQRITPLVIYRSSNAYNNFVCLLAYSVLQTELFHRQNTEQNRNINVTNPTNMRSSSTWEWQ